MTTEKSLEASARLGLTRVGTSRPLISNVLHQLKALQNTSSSLKGKHIQLHNLFGSSVATAMQAAAFIPDILFPFTPVLFPRKAGKSALLSYSVHHAHTESSHTTQGCPSPTYKLISFSFWYKKAIFTHTLEGTVTLKQNKTNQTKAKRKHLLLLHKEKAKLCRAQRQQRRPPHSSGYSAPASPALFPPPMPCLTVNCWIHPLLLTSVTVCYKKNGYE